MTRLLNTWIGAGLLALLCTSHGPFVRAQEKAVSAGPSASPAAQAAQPVAPPRLDPLVAILDADPLELARVAQRLGDRAVLDRLATKHTTEVRLAAIRATPYLRQPEAALIVLCPLVGERDGVLAQAASRALLAIVTALDPDALSRHEFSRAELKPVHTQLLHWSTLAHLRADLRAQANAAAAMLGALVGATAASASD